MSKPFAVRPAHPGRICWGCDRCRKVDELMCGNGVLVTMHPCELFGEDWMLWGSVVGQGDRPAASPVTVAGDPTG